MPKGIFFDRDKSNTLNFRWILNCVVGKIKLWYEGHKKYEL